MLTAFVLAVRDAFAPAQRRALLTSLALALVLLVALWLGASALVAGLHLSALRWLDAAVDVMGSLAALVVAWMLFPAMTMLVLGFFLDGVVTNIERAHYPGLPAPRPIGIGDAVLSAVRLVVLAVFLNLLLLPLYLVPGLNLFVYYGLNGYLVGREYFELVALRRTDRRGLRALWRSDRGGFVLAGAIIAFMLSVPLLNLAAPLIGAAFMAHLVEGLRRE